MACWPCEMKLSISSLEIEPFWSASSFENSDEAPVPGEFVPVPGRFCPVMVKSDVLSLLPERRLSSASKPLFRNDDPTPRRDPAMIGAMAGLQFRAATDTAQNQSDAGTEPASWPPSAEACAGPG